MKWTIFALVGVSALAGADRHHGSVIRPIR